MLRGAKRFRLLVALTAAVVAVGLAHYVRFTADDAYIVARYAENLVDSGELVFNPGERVAAFTSPLQVLVEALLYAATGATRIPYQVLSILLVALAVALLLRRLREGVFGRPIVLVVVVLSPCVLLWTVGGLETPLLLFLVTLLAVLARGRPGLGRLCAIFVVAGLCLLTRHDSLLFAAPVVLQAGRRARRAARVALAALLGALAPAAWGVFAWRYYGELLPTSFYVKMPRFGEAEPLANALYVGAYLVLTGLVPLFALLLAHCRPRPFLVEVLGPRLRRGWGLHLGLAAMLAYGLWIATVHMLFSFRYFVPYLPAAALALAGLYRRAAERLPEAGVRRLESRFLTAALVLALFQGYQGFHTWDRSLNGLYPGGEYPRTGIRDYAAGMLAARRAAAEEIRRHWRGLGRPGAPRIFTTAGGMLPYTYRDSYVLERLVSYRHRCPMERAELGAFADYVHFVSPRHGRVSDRLAGAVERYELVSSRFVVYDGVLESFLVYYDPRPAANPLPVRVDGRCRWEQR